MKMSGDLAARVSELEARNSELEKKLANDASRRDEQVGFCGVLYWARDEGLGFGVWGLGFKGGFPRGGMSKRLSAGLISRLLHAAGDISEARGILRSPVGD